MINRRLFLSAGCGALAACVASADKKQTSGPVKIMKFSDDGKQQGLVTVEKVVMSTDEWKKKLSSEEYDITREAGTEPPFHNRYWNNHDKGLYRCVDCANALFTSDTKYESGTGWPSFWAPIDPHNIRTALDLSYGKRTEVKCTQCDAHLGHVFDDGPQPTGLRYCMNSFAMKFIKY
jgi:peptide-methionine (R)-S-oxide reductase